MQWVVRLTMVSTVLVLGLTTARSSTPGQKPGLKDKVPAGLPAATKKKVDFVKDIKPIFKQHCYSCHAGDTQEGGFRLDIGKRAKQGGDTGAPWEVGKSGLSDMVHRVARLDDDLAMPPEDSEEALSKDQIALLRAWIDQGADWPQAADDGSENVDHWAFKPIMRPQLPAVKDNRWVRNAVDRFVLAQLEAKGLRPADEADRSTLIRRLSLDLLGLPPTSEQSQAFLRDPRPDAYERLVERLLASPAFGERWARHWLDLARYADSDGYEKDRPRPNAWRYRQWVIQAINNDLPFDDFTIDQLAGDMRPNPSTNQLLATGFHRNTLTNREGGVDQEEFRNKAVVDRVSTTSQVWLGLTMGCAQCHTHKYDPLTQREFFGFFAFFNDADEKDLVSAETKKAHQQALARYTQQLKALQKIRQAESKQLARRLPKWEAELQSFYRTPFDGAWQSMPLSSARTASKNGILETTFWDDSILIPLFSKNQIPAKDDYTLQWKLENQPLSAFRLETLLNATGNKPGPGLSGSDNFVLSEFEVYVLDPTKDGKLSKPRKLKLGTPQADYSQPRYPIKNAVDGKRNTGWAVGSAQPMHQSHTALFPLKETVKPAPGRVVRVVLRQQQGSNHLLARFRITAFGGAISNLAGAPTQAQMQALETPAAQRSADQHQLVLDLFARHDQGMKTIDAKIAQHQARRPKTPGVEIMAIDQRTRPRETHVHIRGDFLRKGDKVMPQLPAVLPGFDISHSPNPTETKVEKEPYRDRMDLARWLMQDSNPLTGRVISNRIWQHLFGRGLVRTPEDFGLRGEKPTHPQLLDWLATEYRRVGWSRKSLIRTIVTSSTYRQSSRIRPALQVDDPHNRLLARQNRYRLTGEILRDSNLRASGLLASKLGGPSVRPPLPKGVANLGYANSIKWNTSQGADKYRRGLYIFFQRTVPYPMLMTFDSPDGVVTCTRRERSNTPLQALTLLNDPVFVECAQALGQELADRAKVEKETLDESVDYAFWRLLSRAPSELERSRVKQLYQQMISATKRDHTQAEKLVGRYRPQSASIQAGAAWTAVGRVLLNLDEFQNRE